MTIAHVREIKIQEFQDSYEIKMDFGPGRRVYFGKDGERIVILLGGSAKQRQDAAQTAWAGYRRRKGGKEHGKWH